MTTYLITFPNVFQQVAFKNEPAIYVGILDKVTITSFNRKFCEVKTRHLWGYLLHEHFPGIKILRKQQHQGKLQYIEL